MVVGFFSTYLVIFTFFDIFLADGIFGVSVSKLVRLHFSQNIWVWIQGLERFLELFLSYFLA